MCPAKPSASQAHPSHGSRSHPSSAPLMIEMKRGPDDRRLGEAVAQRLTRDPLRDQRIAASFATDALVAVRLGCPEVRRLGISRERFDLEDEARLDGDPVAGPLAREHDTA